MQRRQMGLTLIEIMIAVAILAVLAAIAIPWYQGYVVEGRYSAAIQDMRQMQLVFDDLAADGALDPSTVQHGIYLDGDGFIVLGGTNPSSPPSGATAWLDPWDNIYLYQRDNATDRTYTLETWGADGADGADDCVIDLKLDGQLVCQ